MNYNLLGYGDCKLHRSFHGVVFAFEVILLKFVDISPKLLRSFKFENMIDNSIFFLLLGWKGFHTLNNVLSSWLTVAHWRFVDGYISQILEEGTKECNFPTGWNEFQILTACSQMSDVSASVFYWVVLKQRLQAQIDSACAFGVWHRFMRLRAFSCGRVKTLRKWWSSSCGRR